MSELAFLKKMYLYRVAAKTGSRWMTASETFTSKSSKVAMRPVQNADLLEKNPLDWARSTTFQTTETELVSYDQLQPPLPHFPPMTYGLGLNYAAHSAETKMDLPKFPIVIGKAPTSLIGPNDPIVIPKVCQLEVDFEVELAIIIGKACKNVLKANALDYVLGYSCANDVSARKWQGKKGGGQWTRAKSFDTFMPIGPGIMLQGSVDCQQLDLKTWVAKGETSPKLMQDANTKDMIFKVASLVEFISEGATLYPWTVILTGTPSGVGYTRNPPVFLEAGDSVQVEIQNIGALWNPVHDEK